jgi:hypothetical protein
MNLRVLGVALACGMLICLTSCKKPAAGEENKQTITQRMMAEKKQARLPVLGVNRIPGIVEEMRAAPNGSVVTVMKKGVKPTIQGAPPVLRVGELWAAPMPTGDAVKIASAVSNFAGGWIHTLDSKHIVFLDAWDQRAGTGDLHVETAANLSGKTERIATGVSYFLPSDDGALLAYLVGGVLNVGPLPAGPFKQLAGEVSTMEFSADARFLYFKRKHSAAGGLYQVNMKEERAQPKRLIDYASEFTVLRSGKHVVATARATAASRELQLHVFDTKALNGRKLSDDAPFFRVSRDGTSIAFRNLHSLKGDTPEVGELYVGKIESGEPVKVGENVKDFEFSFDGTRLVFRANYKELPLGGKEVRADDPNGKTEKVGDLSLIEFPNMTPRLLQKLSPNYLFSPVGNALAFTGRIEQAEITRRLFVLNTGAQKPVAVKDWLYEYMFEPNGKRLFFRADCTREGRACTYLSIPVEFKEKEVPRVELEGVLGTRFSQDGFRSVVAFAHLTDNTFDISMKEWATGTKTSIDQFVEWPVLSLGLTGKSLAYIVKEKGREGLYSAVVP